MSNLFDIVNDVCTTTDDKWVDDSEKLYNAFVINRAMSNYPDCIMYASEMNRSTGLSKRMQYDFYRIGITPKKKRFAKWVKENKTDTVVLISEYYNCNMKLAQQYAELLSDEDVKLIKEKLFKGGKK